MLRRYVGAVFLLFTVIAIFEGVLYPAKYIYRYPDTTVFLLITARSSLTFDLLIIARELFVESLSV